MVFAEANLDLGLAWRVVVPTALNSYWVKHADCERVKLSNFTHIYSHIGRSVGLWCLLGVRSSFRASDCIGQELVFIWGV